MKKMLKLKKRIGEKNVILSIVALILIMLTLVSVSYSWIEEVSNVELVSNDDAQQTPLHVGEKNILYNMTMKNMGNTTGETIDLADYFYESGNMHLSACYSDGENFKFPKSGTMNAAPNGGYRDGTKDDANTNYISATFKITSQGAPTSFWLNKRASANWFETKQNEGSYANTYEKYLRMSVTAGGTTTVYSFDDIGTKDNNPNYGKYQTEYGQNATETVGSNTRDIQHPIKEYMHYTETLPSNPTTTSPMGYWKNTVNKTNKYNQGAGDNLNGNTVFTVGKNKTETVNIKLWLECNNNLSSIDLSKINIQLDSTWKYKRRIYVRDKTMKEYNICELQDKWLSYTNVQNATTAYLYWAFQNDNNTWTSFKLTRYGTSEYYYYDIPAVYNGQACALYRSSSSTFSSTNYWNKWETAFPNTFHSETFTVYSSEYGSWNTEDAKAVFFVDSCWAEDSGGPDVYLWDHNYVTSGSGTSDEKKLVKNAPWPGKKMTKMGWTVGNMNFRAWTFFYHNDYSNAVFNDSVTEWGSGDAYSGDAAYKSQDISRNIANGVTWDGKYFDMATLDWYSEPSKLPNYTDNYLRGNFYTGGRFANTRFAYKGDNTQSSTGNQFLNGTSGSKEACRVFVRYSGDYEFKVYYGGSWYGVGDGASQMTMGQTYTLDKETNNNSKNNVSVKMPNYDNRIYRFYIQNYNSQNNTIEIHFSDTQETN